MTINNGNFLNKLVRRLWIAVATKSFSKRVWVPSDYPPPIDQIALEDCKVLSNRELLIERLNLPTNPVAAEVGVAQGEFSKFILETLHPKELHLFDLRLQHIEILFSEEIELKQVCLHEGDSSTLMSSLSDGYFDLIYIDGDHSYEGVMKDISEATEKLKLNGYLVFNDYTFWSPGECMQYGIVPAVNELLSTGDWEAVYFALEGLMYCDIAIKRKV